MYIFISEALPAKKNKFEYEKLTALSVDAFHLPALFAVSARQESKDSFENLNHYSVNKD